MISNVISSPITAHVAAVSKDTLKFMLEVMAVPIPVILIYAIYKQGRRSLCQRLCSNLAMHRRHNPGLCVNMP